MQCWRFRFNREPLSLERIVSPGPHRDIPNITQSYPCRPFHTALRLKWPGTSQARRQDVRRLKRSKFGRLLDWWWLDISIYKQAEYDQCVFSFPSCSTYSCGFCFCWPSPLPLFATYTLHAMSHQDLHLDESPNSVLRRLQLLETGAPGECGKKLLETSLANSNIDQHHLILVWDEPWIYT